MCYLLITSVCLGNRSCVLDTFLPSLLGLFPVQAGELLKGKVLLSYFPSPGLESTYMSIAS